MLFIALICTRTKLVFDFGMSGHFTTSNRNGRPSSAIFKNYEFKYRVPLAGQHSSYFSQPYPKEPHSPGRSTRNDREFGYLNIKRWPFIAPLTSSN
jgi:hypothetical protein